MGFKEHRTEPEPSGQSTVQKVHSLHSMEYKFSQVITHTRFSLTAHGLHAWALLLHSDTYLLITLQYSGTGAPPWPALPRNHFLASYTNTLGTLWRQHACSSLGAGNHISTAEKTTLSAASAQDKNLFHYSAHYDLFTAKHSCTRDLLHRSSALSSAIICLHVWICRQLTCQFGMHWEYHSFSSVQMVVLTQHVGPCTFRGVLPMPALRIMPGT